MDDPKGPTLRQFVDSIVNYRWRSNKIGKLIYLLLYYLLYFERDSRRATRLCTFVIGANLGGVKYTILFNLANIYGIYAW